MMAAVDENTLGGYFLPAFAIPSNEPGNLTISSTGCPKSHCAKVRDYCSACDHLIRKISSGMFQKSSSFNGFSEIDVHFIE